MTGAEKELLALLKERSFKRGKFTLANGGESNYYIDCRLTTMHGRGAEFVGRVLAAKLYGMAIDAIGGMAVGAVPLVTVAVLSPLVEAKHGFWVRDQAKDHGTGQVIEGCLKPGMRSVVLEDVSTTGKSAAKAVKAVREFGCEVVTVLSLVDRLQGASELFASMGVPYQSVFTVKDFGVET